MWAQKRRQCGGVYPFGHNNDDSVEDSIHLGTKTMTVLRILRIWAQKRRQCRGFYPFGHNNDDSVEDSIHVGTKASQAPPLTPIRNCGVYW